MNVRLILGMMLVAASSTAALAPLRPDQRVAPPVIDLPERNHGSPSGASDGTNVFAAWTDELGRVFGARFDREGTLLAPASIAIDDTGTTLYPTATKQPSVFFTGHHYLVLYTAGWYDTIYGGEVRARRVGIDGRLLDAQPRVVATKTWLVAAASNGTRIAALLHNGFLQMIDLDGNALEAPRAEFSEEISRAKLTASGDGFLVVAQTAKGLIARTLGAGKPDVSAGASPFTFHVASKGTSHVMLYYDRDGLWAVPIQTGGPLPVVGPRKLLDPLANWESDRTPAAVPDGNGFVVVWRRHHEVMAQRLSFDGLPIDTISTLRTVDAEVSDVVAVAGRFASLGSMEATSKRQTVTAMLFHAAGLTAFAPAQSVTVARLPRRQFYPAIGTNGFTSLVAWYESGSPSSYLVRAALIDGSGTVGPPIELGTVPLGIGPFALPAVASDGRDFLVVWSEGRRVAGRRLNVVGQLLDAAPIRVANGLSSATGFYWDQMPASDSLTLAAAWNGQEYVVAFSDQFDVRAATVTRDGAAVTADPSPLISDAVSPLRQPIREIALVCSGSRCELAYRKGTSFDGVRGANDDGGIFAIPVVQDKGAEREIVFAHTPETLNLAAVQKSDGRAIVFFSRGAVTLGSRIAADGSAVDGGGTPIIANEPANTLPLRVTAIGDGIYWGERTVLHPRLRWSRIDFNTLSPEAPTEIDAIAPVAIAVAGGKLLVVYDSADSFFVRVYAAPDAPAGTPRRRAAR